MTQDTQLKTFLLPYLSNSYEYFAIVRNVDLKSLLTFIEFNGRLESDQSKFPISSTDVKFPRSSLSSTSHSSTKGFILRW